VWLGVWSVGVFFLGSQVIQAWRGVLAGGGHRATATAGALFLTLFATPFFVGEIVGLVVLGYAASITVLAILLLVAVVNYLFHYLLKAPTRSGRALLDKIEGFKMFLAAAEKDRLNLLNPPLRTPQLFEMYLPYALALGVEQQWSEQFADVLALAGTAGKTYAPSWYSGAGWQNLGATGFASSLGSSFSSAIASSSRRRRLVGWWRWRRRRRGLVKRSEDSTDGDETDREHHPPRPRQYFLDKPNGLLYLSWREFARCPHGESVSGKAAGNPAGFSAFSFCSKTDKPLVSKPIKEERRWQDFKGK
jgi:hypothetical protein